MTIDADGNIYIVGETPTLYVLAPNASPVPLPAAAWLLLSGLGSGGVASSSQEGLKIRKPSIAGRLEEIFFSFLPAAPAARQSKEK